MQNVLKAALLGGSLAVLVAEFCMALKSSLQFSNELRFFFFYRKLPPSFGEEYLKNQYCSLITGTTVSLECA